MKKIIFLADLYSKDYIGGAELTTDAIIEDCTENYEIERIYCSKLTKELIEKNKNYHWIICNFSLLTIENKLEICKNISYSIIEYDYKFCNYRSLEMHKQKQQQDCDCSLREENKINLIFYGMAKRVWFMSNLQRKIFLKNVKTLKQENTEVLSSVFSKKDLLLIDSLKNTKKNDKFLIVKSNFWIKGFDQSIEYAKNNNLEFEIVSNLKHCDLLDKLSMSKGLIFLPKGSDTCPRLVLEAQMLNCSLILNEFVQHKDEDWARTPETCFDYLNTRSNFFWNFYKTQQSGEIE
jgi:hypothetical protein